MLSLDLAPVSTTLPLVKQNGANESKLGPKLRLHSRIPDKDEEDYLRFSHAIDQSREYFRLVPANQGQRALEKRKERLAQGSTHVVKSWWLELRPSRRIANLTSQLPTMF